MEEVCLPSPPYCSLPWERQGRIAPRMSSLRNVFQSNIWNFLLICVSLITINFICHPLGFSIIYTLMISNRNCSCYSETGIFIALDCVNGNINMLITFLHSQFRNHLLGRLLWPHTAINHLQSLDAFPSLQTIWIKSSISQWHQLVRQIHISVKLEWT